MTLTINPAIQKTIFLLFLLIPIFSLPGCDCDLKITTTSLPDGVVGVNYSVSLDSDCGGDTWFLQSGDLPPGIGLSQNGRLSGTPTLVGTFVMTIGVVDDFDNDVAFKGFSITVVNGNL